jgi:hypothetical protein
MTGIRSTQYQRCCSTTDPARSTPQRGHTKATARVGFVRTPTPCSLIIGNLTIVVSLSSNRFLGDVGSSTRAMSALDHS